MTEAWKSQSMELVLHGAPTVNLGFKVTQCLVHMAGPGGLSGIVCRNNFQSHKQ